MKINNLKWCFVLAFTVFQQLSFGQTVLKTMKRLPDTGVKTGYTNTPGEDADFTINEPFFIVNANGTALDTITGLLWQRGDGGEMTIENARKYCDTLTLGGYTNWRLPRVNEAYSILNHQNTNPALDANVFIKNAAQYWWTGDVQFNDSQKIWCTNAGGGIGNHPKAETVSAGGTKKFHVRAVRDVTAPVSMQHFTALNSLLVRDEITGLVWSKAPFTDSLTWEDALLYADSCRLGNFTDWRLPNIKELQSIADISRMNPALNTAYYSLAPAMKIWTSTTLPNKTVSAWYLDTRYGITTYDVKTRKNMVLLVRGGSGNVTAGLKSTADKSMVAYPVPFSDVVKLDGISETTYCKVYNLNGKLLQSGALRAILWSELPSGVYLLQVDGRSGALQIVKSAK
jgi:hypothetical protein